MLYNALPSGNCKNQKQLTDFLKKTSTVPLKCPESENIPKNVRELVERMLRFKEEDRIDWLQLS
jgi:hypothetical protein